MNDEVQGVAQGRLTDTQKHYAYAWLVLLGVVVLLVLAEAYVWAVGVGVVGVSVLGALTPESPPRAGRPKR